MAPAENQHPSPGEGSASAGPTRRLRHPGPVASVELSAWRLGAVDRLSTLLAVDRQDECVPTRQISPPAATGALPRLVELDAGPSAIPAWLLVPPRERRRDAAVVALAGHGPGVDALVAAAPPDGDYHGGVARKLHEAGFTVLCPELTSFGRRRTPGSAEGVSSCQVDAMRGLLTGRPVLGRRVLDVQAAVAAARDLPWIDPAHVAVLGGSGGGGLALITAALDERIPVAVVANYLSSFARSFCAVPHCICNAVPDLLTWFEMVDIAAMIAPRGLIIEAGENDPIFPIAATRAAHTELVALWSAVGARAPELVVTQAGHQFLADQAITALSRRLDDR